MEGCNLQVMLAGRSRNNLAARHVVRQEPRCLWSGLKDYLIPLLRVTQIFKACTEVIRPEIRHGIEGLSFAEHILSSYPSLLLRHPPMLNALRTCRRGVTRNVDVLSCAQVFVNRDPSIRIGCQLVAQNPSPDAHPTPITTRSAETVSPLSRNKLFTTPIPSNRATLAAVLNSTPCDSCHCWKTWPTSLPNCFSNGTDSGRMTVTGIFLNAKQEATSIAIKLPPTTATLVPGEEAPRICSASFCDRSVKTFPRFAPGRSSFRGALPGASSSASN